MSVTHNPSDIEPERLGFARNLHVRAAHRDGVWWHRHEANRWQQPGMDRLYIESGDSWDSGDSSGYIDLDDGSVRDGAPVADVDVVTVDGETYVQYWRGRHGDCGPRTELVAVIRR